MDQAVYGLVSKRAREKERTPADRLGQGDEEDVRGSSLEESSIREERMEKDGSGQLRDHNWRDEAVGECRTLRRQNKSKRYCADLETAECGGN
ncbi:unnamed protein product [Nezara viridula]|uniref:Uncharacterized protein n=1 Tax=Nezara viridula TaxID=85310 RepID=A0A9P0H7N4_NEZVI|nr:unnamed protein product [Nezara viridula]